MKEILWPQIETPVHPPPLYPPPNSCRYLIIYIGVRTPANPKRGDWDPKTNLHKCLWSGKQTLPPYERRKKNA